MLFLSSLYLVISEKKTNTQARQINRNPHIEQQKYILDKRPIQGEMFQLETN